MDVNSRHNKINASYASCGYLHKSCYVNKGVHTVRKEIENCHKQNLGKEIQAFFCTVLQSDFKTCSQCLFRVRGLQEKCVCMGFFCFVFFFSKGKLSDQVHWRYSPFPPVCEHMKWRCPGFLLLRGPGDCSVHI